MEIELSKQSLEIIERVRREKGFSTDDEALSYMIDYARNILDSDISGFLHSLIKSYFKNPRG